eukprot:4045043-Karenia_brevis.AAC.1
MRNLRFRRKFSQYYRWCTNNGQTPKFRVFLVYVGIKLRFDRVRVMALNSTTLLRIKPNGFSIAEIAEYVSKVVAELEADEVPPANLMFQH